jgi:membrane-associated phospholipid phosphatase
MTMHASGRPITGGLARDTARRAAALCGASDLVMASSLSAMWLVVALSGASQSLLLSARRLELLLALLMGACVIGRAKLGLSATLRSAVYRIVAVAVLVSSYLMLRDLLPAVRSDSLDASLLAADVRLFGVEPALAVERFTTPALTEYFAFFYFSYFTLCGVFAFVIVGANTNPTATSEFAVGSAMVLGLGHLGYVLVPAYGPVHHLEHMFREPLAGGRFLRLVQETVAAGGAMKDVFPSLHTAMPVWFALFAWRRARVSKHRAWLAAAMVTSFFAFNIVCSTIVLRWHYAVDVIAGLALASFAAWCAPRLQLIERRLRGRAGLAPAWSFSD